MNTCLLCLSLVMSCSYSLKETHTDESEVSPKTPKANEPVDTSHLGVIAIANGRLQLLLENIGFVSTRGWNNSQNHSGSCSCETNLQEVYL